MRERQAARELAIPPLAYSKAFFLVFFVLGGVVLASNRQPVVGHINVDLQILFCETRQLECRGHEIALSILVEVHPIDPTVSVCLNYKLTNSIQLSHGLLGAPEADRLVLFTSSTPPRMRAFSTEELVDNGREVGKAEDRVVRKVSGKGHRKFMNGESRKCARGFCSKLKFAV